MKKLLSVFIAVILMIWAMPVTGFADSEKVTVYGNSISVHAKQICFVIGDKDDTIINYMAEDYYAPGFKNYYYIPEGTTVDFKVIAEKLPELQNLAVVYGEVKNLSALADLKDLVWLGLYQNDGAENLSFLKKLPRLKKFRYVNVYGDNSCESIKPVSYLKNLTELYLYVPSAAVYDLAPLKGLTKLKKLKIETTVYENISVLENLKSLQELKIMTGKGSDLSVLGDLKNLKRLDINVRDDPDLSFLEKLTKLESLKISSDGRAEGLDVVTGLENLKSLGLSGFDSWKQDLSFVGEMTGLESLDISYSNKSFTKTIGDLKGLKELSLMDINNSIKYDMSFINELTGLEELFLFGHDGWNGSDISKLKNLKKLTIMLCEFDDLTGLKKLSSLENLFVYNCNADFDVKWIAGMDIKDMYFSAGGDGEIENMDKIATLKKLEKLSLDFTGISEETVKKIKKAVPDCRIEVCELGYGDYETVVY